MVYRKISKPLITGELRNWWRNSNGTYNGRMYKDMHGLFLDGTLRENIAVKSETDYDDYILIRTTGWNLRLDKDQERRRYED